MKKLYTKKLKYLRIHNFLLNIIDGCVDYSFEKDGPTSSYPVSAKNGQKTLNRFIKNEGNKDYHIKHFCNLLFNCINNTTILLPEVSHYISENPEGYNVIIEDIDYK